MSETDAAIIGMHRCGCITYANARPDRLERSDEKVLAEFVREGGQIIRTTVGEARAMPNFLVSECPHDPKGWERKPYVDPAERVRLEKTLRGVYMVRKGYGRVGEVRKLGPIWEATPGWFVRGGGADRGLGGGTGTPAPIAGPFGTRREAVEALT
jgi:hypothetical protein